MKVQPYLFFDGQCDEALEFYKRAVGAKVEMLSRFKDSPDRSIPIRPGTEQKVMHATIRVGDSTILASDGDCKGQVRPQGFAWAINVPTVAEAERVFANLREGGQEQMPLTKTFFSERFGMLADRFGVSWMILAGK